MVVGFLLVLGQSILILPVRLRSLEWSSVSIGEAWLGSTPAPFFLWS